MYHHQAHHQYSVHVGWWWAWPSSNFSSVQISLITLFLDLNLDLVAGRTAPNHSWKNPVECIMGIINLGLQCIGVMRKKGTADFEKAIKMPTTSRPSDSARDIRRWSQRFTFATTAAVERHYLPSCFKGRITLHISWSQWWRGTSFLEVLLLVDDNLNKGDTRNSALKEKPKLQAFMDYCCQISHNSFCIRNVALMKVRSASQCEWMASVSRKYISSQIK